MQTADNQTKTSQPSVKSLTTSGSALLLCAEPVRVSGALKFSVAAQLGTTEPEGEMETELCIGWVNGNGRLALGHR